MKRTVYSLFIFFTLFAVIGCESCMSDDDGDGRAPSPKFGCRAISKSWGFTKNVERYKVNASDKEEARSTAMEIYLIDHPNAKNPDANCWDCSRQDLDRTAKKVCER